MIHPRSTIQNDILSKLKNAKSLRFSEMQSKNIPNDLYNYHLQFLVKKGFVKKDDEGYALADLGLKYIADPYPPNDQILSLFKINVITLVSRIRNGEIEILNQIRKSNPSRGRILIPGGVVLKGEPLLTAATRKLKQETGLNAKFKLLGFERRLLYKSGELFSDVLFPIVYTNSHSGQLQKDNMFGTNVWLSIDKTIKSQSAQCDSIISIKKVLKTIKNRTSNKLPTFYIENIQVDT